MCMSDRMNLAFTYDRLSDMESHFRISEESLFWREMYRCNNCGHYLENFKKDQNNLYLEEYVSSTYTNEEGIRKAFDRVIALDPLKSDNIGRVEYISSFCNKYWGNQSESKKRLLDIGSGLGVFPYQMKKIGWNCTAIDLDPRLVSHHKKIVGISSMKGDLRTQKLVEKFDLISLNKVLEHTKNPIEILSSAKNALSKNGLIYIELPDGEAASYEGKNREEFLIGHIHVFSFLSYGLLVKKSNLQLICCERIREPSSKYTLRGFVRVENE